MIEVGQVGEMTQLAAYSRDSVVAFSCGHTQYSFDMSEVSVPQLITSMHSQQHPYDVMAAVTQEYEHAQRDGGVMRLACPKCVMIALNDRQHHRQSQPSEPIVYSN